MQDRVITDAVTNLQAIESSSVIDPSSTHELRAVLCLAIAEASPELLLATLDNLDPRRKTRYRVVLFFDVRRCSQRLTTFAGTIVCDQARVVQIAYGTGYQSGTSTAKDPTTEHHCGPCFIRTVHGLASILLVGDRHRSERDGRCWAGLCPDSSRSQQEFGLLDFHHRGTCLFVSCISERSANWADIRDERYIAGMTPFEEEQQNQPANYVSWEEAMNS